MINDDNSNGNDDNDVARIQITDKREPRQGTSDAVTVKAEEKIRG